MKLLVLFVFFGAVVTLNADVSIFSSAEEVDDVRRMKRAVCNPGTWCPYNGREYIFESEPKQWAYAQLYCQALGGTLVVVQNRELNSFLRILSSRMDAWIGFSDAQFNGVWLWVNSERVRFTNWCKSEPNNFGGKQDCAVMNYNGENCWDDQDCSLSRPYFCERKLPQP